MISRPTIVLHCLLLSLAAGCIEAEASPISAFQKSRANLKTEISGRFGCSWRPYLEASEQCGDETVVINPSAGEGVESVELTCSLGPSRKAAAKCQAQARWLLSAFEPAWAGRTRWLTKIFANPPPFGRAIRTTVQGTTVLAQTEGPVDQPIRNMVIGVTRGDPQSWDLPR